MLELSDKWLYSDCIDVPLDGSVDISIIVDDMFSIMVEYNGVGLAANQVGLPFKIICINYGEFREVIVNPIMRNMYGDVTHMQEGCLSYPGMRVWVERFDHIHLDCVDQYGEPQSLYLTGMIARIAQHEFDHLYGKTITSK